MSKTILEFIQKASIKGEKLLAILLDPDKTSLEKLAEIALKIETLNANFIFVGGSSVENDMTDLFVETLKKHTKLPVILFPGDFSQLTNHADALLFLSLLS